MNGLKDSITIIQMSLVAGVESHILFLCAVMDENKIWTLNNVIYFNILDYQKDLLLFLLQPLIVQTIYGLDLFVRCVCESILWNISRILMIGGYV